jgi:hypothetical protein
MQLDRSKSWHQSFHREAEGAGDLDERGQTNIDITTFDAANGAQWEVRGGSDFTLQEAEFLSSRSDARADLTLNRVHGEKMGRGT